MNDPPLHPSDDPDDPVNVILAFVQHLAQKPSVTKAPLDRDRLMITLVLALLSDPHHHVGKKITRDLFKVWIERGGRVPQRGIISRSLREADEFDFAVQYLYDYGMPIKDIAMALGCSEPTIKSALKYFTTHT